MPSYLAQLPDGRQYQIDSDVELSKSDLDLHTQKILSSEKQPGAPSSAVGLMSKMASAERLAAQNAPSPLGSFFREGGRSVLPGAAGFAGGMGAGALAGMAGGPFAPITVPVAALVGGLTTGMATRKVQDMAADAIAPNSFAGTVSSTQDYQTNPMSTLLGGTLATGRPAPFRAAGAIKTLATQEGRALLSQAIQKGAPAVAKTALDDVVDVAAGAGIGAGMSLASGDGMALENAGAGILFNRAWIGGRPSLSTDSQHGVQGGPATGSPSGDGVVPVEKNAAVVTPMVGDGVRLTGPLQAAGATRLAGDLAARAGLDPLTLTPSGDNATVTPNDVRAAGARLPAITQDSGGTMEIPFTRKPDPTIQELLGRDVEWDGNLGKLVDDEGRPGLQLPDNSILELPFAYGTDRALADLGVKPVGNKAADRSTATRLFGTTEQESMQAVFSKLDDVTDDLLDIAELGASMKKRKGQTSIPVRDTPEFAATSRSVTDEQILIAQDQVNQALETAKNAPGLTPDTRSAIIDKLTGDLDNISALSAARDAWQRQRVPLPVSSPEPPSQRATLAAADAASNRAAAVSELNGLTPRRPTAPALVEPARPALPPAPVEPSRQLGQRPFNSTEVASRLRTAVEPSVPPAPEPPAPVPVPVTPATPLPPLKGSVALATGRLNSAKNQLAKLEASGKASPEQIAKRRASITTLEQQIKAAGPAPLSRARQLQKRVDEVIDSGEFNIITQILQNGGFAPQNRQAGLIERNERRGAKLSEKSRKVADGFGETRNDAARASDFPDTPAGNLAAETLRSLHNRSSTAMSVDKMAEALGMTVRDFHAALNAEIDSIYRNNGTKTSEYDARMARDEQQFVEFDKAVEDAPAAAKATPDELGLEKGDTLTIDGEPITVAKVTDDTVTLRDHDRFGDQVVPVDQPIPADNLNSQAKARVADEAPDAIAADEAATRRQAEEHMAESANEKPPADDFTLKPHESDADIKAEQAALAAAAEARAKAAPVETDAQKIERLRKARMTGTLGDTTSDMFDPIAGDTPLFNERRDAATPKPMSLEERINAIPEVEPKLSENATEFEKNLHTAMWARERGLAKGAPLDPRKVAEIRRQSESTQQATQQKSLIDGLKAHQDEVKGWIKGEQKSGRINSMPIDILGAQAYDAALTSVIKLMETGVRIGKAVRTVIADIKKTRQLSRDEEATIKAALIAKSQDSLRFAGERDAKLMLEMPKIAEELVAQGKTPTQQDLIAALATRFPDQAPYIKAKGDKIFKDMMFARDKRLSRTTDSQREWGEWADNAIDGTRKMVDSFTKGAPLTNVKQFATNFHATYMTGIGNKMRHLAEGNITGNSSNAWGKWTEDLVGLAKGKDGVHRVSTDLAMKTDVTTFANHLDRIKTDLNPMLNKMPRGERKAFMERVGDHITDASRDGELVNQPELKRAVEAYVKIREDLLKHMKDSGVEVGDVGPRSMRRVLDRPTILGNPDEFMKQAANAYKAKWRAETAKLNAEAAGLDPIKNKDRLASIKTELAEIAKRDAADSARKYLTNIEADEVGITSDGNDLFSHNNGNPSSIKSREFGPEADQLLGKFYLRDPDAILRREIGDSVRAAGVARTFSGPALDPQGNPRPNGEIDPMAKWKKLRQDLIDEGNADMIPMAATLLKEHFNLGGQDNPTMRAALEIAHTHTQLAFLARSAFSSLGEPALAGIRSGKLSDIAAGYVKTFKGMARELRGLGPDEARIISNAIGTSNDGFNSILAANRFLDSYAVAGKSGELVAMFHAKTWLTALTNATHAASVDISHGFIRTQLELRQAGGKYKTVAGKHLNEIGITTADIPAMLKFTDDLAKSTDKVKLLTADTPEAKMYRNALHLIKMSGGSLEVLRGTRPQHANSPVGGMFYALKSFLFAFQDQVLSRHARLMKTAARGETMVDGVMEKLSAAERTQMIGETVQAVATLAAAQYGIQVLRESLFSDPARMKEESKTPAEKARMRAYSVATRSSFFGGYDILFNAMTGARHGGDPSTAALGPSGGLAGSIFGQIAGIGGKKDSPNTNTHERKLTRSIWDFTAKPLANAATATLPGYKIATPLIQAFNHPGTREALVKTVAGPPMKGGPMKKKSPGF